MIVFNVTLNVEEPVHTDWSAWMQEVYIPEMLKTGLFIEYRIFRMLTDQDETPGHTYAYQYYLSDLNAFLHFTENHAGRFQQMMVDKFGDKVLAYQTLLEVVK